MRGPLYRHVGRIVSRSETDRGRSERGKQSRRATLRRGAATVGIAGVAGCLRTGSVTEERSSPALIGHRGCAAEGPENTISAIESAVTVVDAIEVDVRRCKTGELVVFHDETLDRLTDDDGRVNRTPCNVILDLEIGDTGESIPTLDEVFEVVPPDVALVLDLKESGLTDDVLALHADYDHELLLSSFSPSVLREVDSSVSTAYIVRESIVNRILRPAIPGLPSWVYAPEDLTGLIRRTVALGCDAIHPRYELCLQTDIVARAHAADLRVEPWTITTEREFEALRDVGVDAVISDVCDGLLD